MKKKRQVAFATGVAVLTVFTLVGCSTPSGGQSFNQTSNGTASTGNSGTTQSNDTSSTGVGITGATASTPGTNSSGSNTQTASGSANVPQSNEPGTPSPTNPFPLIVQMAMKHLPSSVLKGAIAPTMFPISDTGSTTLFYRTSSTTSPIMGFPGFEFNYDVQFSSPNAKLADYSSARYDTAIEAINGFQSEIGDIAHAQGTTSAVQLGYGHTGTMTVDNDNSSASIYWSEGRWQIRVTDSGSTTPPIATAKQVVSYLESHFMPVPHNNAAIVVTLNGNDINTMVVWQQQNQMYQVNTYPHCQDPVRTALEMAISMRSWPIG